MLIVTIQSFKLLFSCNWRWYFIKSNSRFWM